MDMVGHDWHKRHILCGMDGQHAFVYYFPTVLEAGTGERIDVTFAGTRESIGGSPKVITCE